MHSVVRNCLFLLFATTSLAASLPNNHVLHEKREFEHPLWVKRSKVPSHRRMPMRIALTQSNLDKGQDYLMDVYVPHFAFTESRPTFDDGSRPRLIHKSQFTSGFG